MRILGQCTSGGNYDTVRDPTRTSGSDIVIACLVRSHDP